MHVIWFITSCLVSLMQRGVGSSGDLHTKWSFLCCYVIYASPQNTSLRFMMSDAKLTVFLLLCFSCLSDCHQLLLLNIQNIPDYHYTEIDPWHTMLFHKMFWLHRLVQGSNDSISELDYMVNGLDSKTRHSK